MHARFVQVQLKLCQCMHQSYEQQISSTHERRILGVPITYYARQVCTSTIENCVSVCISHMNNEYPVHMHAEY